MTVLNVRYFGDPILRTVSDEVPQDHLDSRSLHTLIEDMLETMDAYKGVGLAGNQVGDPRRVFVYDCEGDRGHIVNPQWEACGEDTQTGPEGCLSIPEIRGNVTRYERVRVTGVTVGGEPVDREVTGLLARCVQHETDHLNGIMFLKHLPAEERKNAMKTIRNATWFQ